MGEKAGLNGDSSSQQPSSEDENVKSTKKATLDNQNEETGSTGLIFVVSALMLTVFLVST